MGVYKNRKKTENKKPKNDVSVPKGCLQPHREPRISPKKYIMTRQTEIKYLSTKDSISARTDASKPGSPQTEITLSSTQAERHASLTETRPTAEMMTQLTRRNHVGTP